MFAHSDDKETTEFRDVDKNSSLANRGYGCGAEAQPRLQVPECYTCTRMLHHQIPSILNTIDELFGEAIATTTATKTTPPPPSSPNHSQSRLQEHQYAPTLERALLEGHDEQSSIISFGVGVGNLSLSPPQRFEMECEDDT